MPFIIPRAASAFSGRAVAATALRTIVMRAMPIRLDPKWLPSEGWQHAPQTLFQLDLRLPAEQLPGPGDVRLANLRIVDWQCFEHDLALRRCDQENRLREVENRKLLRVAQVDREMLLALGQEVQATDQVVDVAEAAGLRAVAEDRERPVLERLAH